MSEMRPFALAALALLGACAHATPRICDAKIARTWHGSVPAARAEDYAAYLTPAIAKFRAIPGNLGYQMMRETVGDETHFTVISYWRNRDDIRGYAGDDISKVRSLPRDPEFLIEVEPTVKNYEIVVKNIGCPAES